MRWSILASACTERGAPNGQSMATQVDARTTPIPVTSTFTERRTERSYVVLRRLQRDKVGAVGGIIFLLIVAITLAAPIVAPHDPDQISLKHRFEPVGSAGYWLGADAFGRDLLSRIIWGGRASLTVGLTATIIATSVGITDVLLAFPNLLLSIVIVGALGPGLRNAMLAVAISGIPFYIRLIRGMILSLREQQYVDAARSMGATHARIIRRAILPSLLPYIIVTFSINVGWLILEAAG